MELPDKIINNLTALAGAFLIGEKPVFAALVMAELWQQIAEAQKYLDEKNKKANETSAPQA